MKDPPAARDSPGSGGTTDVAGIPGAPSSAPAGPGGAHGQGAPLEDSGCESWVRDKVLFLLHPERWLGTRRDPGGAGLGAGAPGDGVDGGCPSPTPGPREPSGTDPAARAPPQDSAAPARSVLVRIVDYEVTQEVLRRAWTRGQMTTRTEERSVTAVTFRTGRE